MFEVRFTATVLNPDTEETFNGWVDPNWSMWTLYTDREDVGCTTFDSHSEAVAFVENMIGGIDHNDGSTLYGADSRRNDDSGEDWIYAGHIREV